jgi:CMP-N-acetylneuraminic acid synthetase
LLNCLKQKYIGNQYMKTRKIVAIIPARGGSKRLKNKNLQLLNGLPLFVHSINYAKENRDIIDSIYVSTDDSEIESIARKAGVNVIKRPSVLSNDTATTVSVLLHAIQNIKEDYDFVVLLQPTNPLRPKNLLKEACEILEKENCDSLMTVSPNHQKFGKINKGKFIPFNYTMGQRSQDLEPLYYENGLLYITKAKFILKSEILTENNYPFIVDHPFGTVDIDVEADLKNAQFIINNYTNE